MTQHMRCMYNAANLCSHQYLVLCMPLYSHLLNGGQCQQDSKRVMP